jgi:hypothetical protein
MTQETRQGRFVDYQRLARLVSQEVSWFGVFADFLDLDVNLAFDVSC